MLKKTYLMMVIYMYGVNVNDVYAALNCSPGQTCFSLEAKDDDNGGRTASDGGTLSMVVSDTGSRSATITATANGDATGSFEDGEPTWTGQNSGSDGDTSVGYGSSSIINSTVQATADGNSESVIIDLVGKQANTVTIGTFNSDSTMHNVKDKLKFPGGASATVAWSVGNTSYNSEMVDIYNSPTVDWKRKVTLGISGSVTGRITHPQFSGSVGSWVVWELFADLSISGSVTGGMESDPSLADSSWKSQNLAGSVTGSVQAGFYVYCNVFFVQIEGSLSASTSATGSVQLQGSDVQLMASWGGLNGNVSLKCHGSDPNNPWVEYSGTKTLIAGNSTPWKTVFTLP